MITKKCILCLSDFKSLKSKTKYCSHNCYWTSLKNKKPWNFGKKCPNMSKSKIGHIVTSNTRIKISRALVGRKRPNHEKNKISKNNAKFWLGKKRPEISGDKHVWYIKDRSKLKKIDHRRSTANFEWRSNVLKRDGHACSLHNSECSGKIIAHHIKPWRSYPELRYELTNGIALCEKHHPRKYSEEERMAPIFVEIINNK